MNGSETNTSPSAADNATAGADVTALSPELGPNGLPINPPEGEAPPTVEHDFIMDTLFGEGNAEPPPNSGEGQGKGSNSSEGQSKGSLAPPTAAPAANGEEGSPQPGPSSTGQQPGQQQASGEGTTPQTPGQGQPASPESPPAPQLSIEDRLKLASADALAQQNRELLDRLRRLEQGDGQQPQSQGQGQQPPSNQPGGGQEPPLRLVVPDQLFDAMMSDEPATAKQAVSVLITAVAENAVQAAMKRVVPVIDQRMSAVTQALTAGEEVQRMENAYFERYPTHQNELFKPLIQQVVQEKYAAFPHAKWDETMMDAVGATVNEKLKALGIDPSKPQGSTQQTEPNGKAPNGNGGTKAPAKPAPMLDGGTRAGGGVPDNAGDFIRSTFG